MGEVKTIGQRLRDIEGLWLDVPASERCHRAAQVASDTAALLVELGHEKFEFHGNYRVVVRDGTPHLFAFRTPEYLEGFEGFVDSSTPVQRQFALDLDADWLPELKRWLEARLRGNVARIEAEAGEAWIPPSHRPGAAETPMPNTY